MPTNIASEEKLREKSKAEIRRKHKKSEGLKKRRAWVS